MMAENRLRFSQRLNEMSEELSILAKEVEKNRKQVRTGAEYEFTRSDHVAVVKGFGYSL
jgi:hypothetical protein